MIQDIFRRFLAFMMNNRKTGHTSLLEKIAKENDVYIIIDHQESKKNFSEDVHANLVPLTELYRLEGIENKPVLIDNDALQTMLRQMLLECGTLEEQNKLRDHHLQQIEHILEIYRKAFPKPTRPGFEEIVAGSAIRMTRPDM